MKKTSPISLFSFQDIITCLTGIMIVVVLVMLLQLVESTATIMKRSKLLPEHNILQERSSILKQQRDLLLQKLKNHSTEQNEYADISLPEIKNQLQDELKYNQVLQRQEADLQKIYSTTTSNIEKLKLKLQQTRNSIKELSKDEKTVQELETMLLALEAQKNSTEEMIEKKRKTLRFEFSGFAEETPILIECNGWGFRVKSWPNGEVTTLGAPSGSLTKQLPILVEKLSRENIQSSYYVFLFKEDAIGYYDMIITAVSKEIPGAKMGFEPIANAEECF